MKPSIRIAISVALAVTLSLVVRNIPVSDNDVLKDMQCASKVMVSSPSIVTICQLGDEAKHFVTPLNKE